uniref:Phospholipid/glycerol acyltransferase domain-containing protein n=1 Tax=Plectus sambesii TaxID=2011161 RepID=A0A914V0F7_9BILA
MEQLLILLGTFLFPPLLGLVILVIVLATFGKSLGIRRKYVATLLRIFEWGTKQVNNAIRQKREASGEESDNERLDGEISIADDSENNRRRHGSGKLGIIKREASERMMDKLTSEQPIVRSRAFTIADDSLDFIKAGIESIIEDEVTSRFEAEDLASWNLLTRTSGSYQFLNWKLTLLWGLGFAFRYGFLFPTRVIIISVGLIWLIIATAMIGLVPDGDTKRSLNRKVMLMCNRILSRCVSSIVTFHDSENMAQNGGICVANHTSPIDVMILSTDNVYALIGQSQGGLLGVVQRALSRASSHIWFERSEAKDRALVTQRLKEHTADPDKLPILIFPEGTCINNTSVMMFKKGSFEIGTKIYPIAMKYDSRFGDPFWNSSEQSWGEYILRMMTSWAIIVDVWYLPPMEKLPNEDAVMFANRVKQKIAKRGGLIDLEWDGQLKRQKVPDKLVAQQQQLYWKRLNRTTSVGNQAAPSRDERSNEPTTIAELPDDVFADEDQFGEHREAIPDELADTNDSRNEPDSGVASEIASESS